jgi:hypothetical protein
MLRMAIDGIMPGEIYERALRFERQELTRWSDEVGAKRTFPPAMYGPAWTEGGEETGA